MMEKISRFSSFTKMLQEPLYLEGIVQHQWGKMNPHCLFFWGEKRLKGIPALYFLLWTVRMIRRIGYPGCCESRGNVTNPFPKSREGDPCTEVRGPGPFPTGYSFPEPLISPYSIS
jgi:hypothetical protein